MQFTSNPKYMEFLPKKKRIGILKVTQRPIVNLDTSVVFDFIELCVNDIISQLSGKNTGTKDLEIISNPQFLDHMYFTIMDESLHYGKKYDLLDGVNLDSQDWDTEDLFEKIKQEMLNYPEIKIELLSRISSVYLSKCLEYSLDPNPKIITKLFG
jgi:hypothetical protein